MISVDWQNKIVESTASILDLPVFHAALRDLEDSSEGVIHPVTHTWKALDQGGGAFMYQADLINGYHLKFPVPGNYEISGNLKGVIDPVAGVYVERQTSTAYITTAQGSTGPTAESIAAAIGQRVIDNGLSNDALLRILLAALAGKTAGLGTDTEQYLAQDGITPRITAQFDANNNRTSVTLNGA